MMNCLLNLKLPISFAQLFFHITFFLLLVRLGSDIWHPPRSLVKAFWSSQKCLGSVALQ